MRYYRLYILISFLLLILCFNGKGQEYYCFDYLTRENNLSQNSVFDIQQDKYGFIWIATQLGLDRYDGQDFRLYKYEAQNPLQSLPAGFVYVIEPNKEKDTLWVGTASGLAKLYYDPPTYSYKIESTTSIKEQVRAIKILSNGDLWLSTGKKVYRKRGKEQPKRIKFPNNISEKTLNISSLEENPITKTIIIGTNQGLITLENEELTSFLPQFPLGEISAMYADEDSLYVACKESGLKKYEFQENGDVVREVNIRYSNSIPTYLRKPIITQIMKNSDGEIWLGSEKSGIYIYKPNNESRINTHLRKKFNNKRGLSSDLILSLYQSEDEVLWIGTNGRGINKWAPLKPKIYQYFDRYEDSSKRSINDVWALFKFQDDPHHIWLGTDGDGLVKWDVVKNTHVKWYFLDEESSSTDRTVRALKGYGETLLVGTHSGLFRINVKEDNAKPERIEIVPKIPVRSIYRNPNNGQIWVGTGYQNQKKGIIILDRTFAKVDSLLYKDDLIINSIRSTHQENIWVGTDKGLFRYLLLENGTYKKAREKPYGNNHITSLYVKQRENPQENRVWIGTREDGLKYFDYNKEDELKTYKKEHGNLDQTVYGIIEDSEKHLWISTNSGIYQLVEDLGVYNNYTMLDGLQDNEFNSGAYFCIKGNKEGQDDLYFGGVNGFNHIRPIDWPKNERKNRYVLLLKQGKLDKSIGEEMIIFKENYNDNISPKYESVYELRIRNLNFQDPQNNLAEFSLNAKNKWTPLKADNFITEMNGETLAEEVFEFRLRNSFADWDKEGLGKVSIQTFQDALEEEEWFNTILYALAAFSLGSITILYLFVRKDQQKDQLERDATLRDKINAISRKKTRKAICKLALVHLTDFFQFDYATFATIDHNLNKLVVPYGRKVHPKIKPTELWRHLINYDLTMEDVMVQVIRDKKTIIVDQDKINGKAVDTSKHNELHPLIFGRFKKNLVRAYIPMIRRAEHPTERDDDMVLGVIEVGYHKETKSEIIEKELQDLYIYIDNCAQPYYWALMEEEKTKLDKILLDHENIDNPGTYFKKILESAVKWIGGSKGDIGFISLNKKEDWAPENIITYNIDPDDLIKVRKVNQALPELQQKKGIYRHAFTTKMPYFAEEAEEDPYYIEGISEVKAQLSVPLIYYNTPVGVMSIYFETPQYFYRNWKIYAVEYLIQKSIISYQKKKATETYLRLIKPSNVFAIENIYKPLIQVIEDYFSTELVSIWEMEVLEKTYLYRLEEASESLKVMYESEGLSSIEVHKISFFYSIDSAYVFHVNNLKASCKELGDFAMKHNYQCMIIIPLRIENWKYGFINIFSERIPHLFQDDKIFLNQIANKGTLAGLRSKFIHSFIEISKSFPNEDLDQTLNKIADSAREVLHSNPVILYQSEIGSKILIENAAVSGKLFHPENVKTNRTKATLVEEIFRNGPEYVMNDEEYLTLLKRRNPTISKISENYFWRKEKIESFAAIRLENEGIPVGVIFFNFRQKQNFTPETKELIDAFASLITTAIVNVQKLRHNERITELNVRLLKPLLEGTIVTGLLHNTYNDFIGLAQKYKRFNERIPHIDKSKALYEARDFMKDINAPLMAVQNGFQKLRGYWKPDGQYPEEKQIVEISQIVEKAVSITQNRLTENRITPKINLEDGMEAFGHAYQLQQVLVNLILNAIQAMESSKQRELKVEGKKKDDGWIEIKIIDYGHGIKEEDYAKITRAFYTTKDDKGSGVGLTISKLVIEEEHKGFLKFHSTPRKTIFSILLPPIPKHLLKA